jgi:hypothetical protein
MLLASVNQWQVALYLLGGGIALGVLYDLFRAARRLFRPGKLITVLVDVVFCIVALPGLFALLWSAAAMALRPWMALGIALGAGLYFAGPSVFLMKGWMALTRALQRLWRRLRASRLAAWLSR